MNTKIDIKKEISDLNEELISLRRDFHMHPELGYQEFRTSKIVKAYLENLGIETKIVTETGVVGLLKGAKEGKTVLLRADMDALPVEEKTDVAYKSVEAGKMHACGHDGHTAMLLVAAKTLANHKEQLAGNVMFVFQPNEEQAGALNMINEGILENPKVDAAFAIHLWTPIESGKIGISSGPVVAADEEFELTVMGKAGHTSAPHAAIDPILIGSTIVQAIQSLETRETSPLKPLTIMVGSFHAGTGPNIIPEQVQMSGTIRFMFENEEEEKKALLEKFERLVKGICDAMGTTYKLKFIPSNPSAMNDSQMAELIKETAKDTLGEGCTISYKCMVGEDFADFTHRVPSALYFVGTGDAAKETHYPHHHPKFNIDEDTLKIGVEMHVRSVFNYLES